MKTLDNRIEYVSAFVIACCVLYNICQMNKDDYVGQDGMLEAILAHERERQDRRGQSNDGSILCLLTLLTLFIKLGYNGKILKS